MAIGNFLEDMGTSVTQQGLANRRYQSPVAVGLESALGGFAAGQGFKRARALRAAQKDFENKIGMNYELFSKLSGAAQAEILKHSGVVSDPMDQPLAQFGGQSFKQVQYGGAPSPTETAPGTGAFAGGLLPNAPDDPAAGEVQTGPPLPPTELLGAAGAAKAIDRYQGVQGQVDPTKQSLIDYRNKRLDQFGQDAERRARESRARIGLMGDQRKAINALTKNRQRPDRPVEPWEAATARQMGVPIPEGVTPTRSAFDRAMKYNKPAGAVIMSIDRLSSLAREAEITMRRKLTDKELDNVIQRETGQLPALAGPNAVGIVLQGVKQQLESLRRQPDVWNTPAAGSDQGDSEDPEANQDVPDQLEEDDSGDGYDESP